MENAYSHRVADELAIRNLSGRYVDAIHCRDKVAWGTTWAENGEWRLPDMAHPGEQVTMRGREAIVSGWVKAMQGFPLVLHIAHSPTIRLDEHEATGRWYVAEQLIDQEGNQIKLYGFYDDTYLKVDGDWLFRMRAFSILYSGPTDLSGTTVTYPPAQKP